MTPFLPILSLILPLVALFIELFLPLAFLVEEILKAILVFTIPKDSKHKIQLAVLIGAGFALTETFIYSTSIFLTGRASLFLKRLVVTMLLHSGTTLIMGVSILKSKNFLVVGLVIGILIHYLYNLSLRV